MANMFSVVCIATSLLACGEPVKATETPDGGSNPDAGADAAEQNSGDLVISSLTQSVLEGSSAQFTVALSAEPAGEVLVTLSSSDLAKARVTTTSLQFDATNWSTPEAVTIFGEQDADTMDDGAAIVVTSAVGDATVTITVLDDDTPAGNVAIELSTVSVGVIEGMQTVFQVRLTAQPAATTIVSIASSNTSSVSASPGSLTFTTADWDMFQNVVVTGVEDNNVAADVATATVSSSGLATTGLMVTTTDNDTQALVVSQSTMLTVNEGASQPFNVRLAFQPPGDVMVSVGSSLTGTASVSLTGLTFTNKNWNTDQIVSIGGVQDTDFTHDQSTITVSSSGLTSKLFTVVVPDNDLINAPAAATACRNFTSNPVSVHLSGAPFTASLVVSASATGGTVTSARTYSAANSPQSFSFDPAATGSTGSITLTAPGQTSRSVSITILPSTDPECTLN